MRERYKIGNRKKKDIRSPSANNLFSSGVAATRGCTSLARLVRASRHTIENRPVSADWYNKRAKRGRRTYQHRLVRTLFSRRDTLHLDGNLHGAATCMDDMAAEAEIAPGVERVKHV